MLFCEEELDRGVEAPPRICQILTVPHFQVSHYINFHTCNRREHHYDNKKKERRTRLPPAAISKSALVSSSHPQLNNTPHLFHTKEPINCRLEHLDRRISIHCCECFVSCCVAQIASDWQQIYLRRGGRGDIPKAGHSL